METPTYCPNCRKDVFVLVCEFGKYWMFVCCFCQKQIEIREKS